MASCCQIAKQCVDGAKVKGRKERSKENGVMRWGGEGWRSRQEGSPVVLLLYIAGGLSSGGRVLMVTTLNNLFPEADREELGCIQIGRTPGQPHQPRIWKPSDSKRIRKIDSVYSGEETSYFNSEHSLQIFAEKPLDLFHAPLKG